MRLKNGDLILTDVRIPLVVQPVLLPALLAHYPENYKALGMDFDTYWDFCIEARKEFLNNLIRINLVPPVEKLRKIFIKERKTPLESFLKWVNFIRENKETQEQYKTWIELLDETFSGMDVNSLLKVWKKLHRPGLRNAQTILLKYYPDSVLPLLLKDAGSDIRAQVEARMKRG